LITSNLIVSTLVEEAIGHLYRTAERPKPVTLSDGLADATDTSFTLATSDDWQAVSVTDTVEFGSELVYISAKTSDAQPVYTCIRGMEGTTPVAHISGTGLLNPAFPRYKVFNNVRDWFRRSNAALPLVTSETATVVTDKLYVPMPADTMKVFRVGYFNPDTMLFFPLDGWQFFDDIPVSQVSTGKYLRVAPYVANADLLTITYQKQYTVPVAETDTVQIPLGGEVCPSLYAAAFLLSKREVSRLELENATEWQSLEVLRSGQNLGITRDYWQQYYKAIDDAKRTYQPPRHRPYVKTRRFI
jgi:hypothetical protein